MNLGQPRLALFIPTYNSAGTIVKLLNTISPEVARSFAAIYVIDNHSTDKTVSLVQEFAQSHPDFNMQIYVNSENYLLGGSTIIALKIAIQSAHDYLVCIHSDGQADPRDLSLFITHCREDRYDFILGSRLIAGSQTADYSRLRWWVNWAFAKLQQPLLKTSVYDLGAYVAFNLATLREFKFTAVTPDMGYHPLLILTLARVNENPLRFMEFPVRWGKVETSTVNVLSYGFNHLIRLMKLYLARPSLDVDYSVNFKTERLTSVGGDPESE